MKRFTTILMLFLGLSSAQAQQPREEILKVCNWHEYIGQGLIEEFEQWYKEQTGRPIKVEYDTFDFPEEELARIHGGDKDYDVFCTPEYLVERMLRYRLLQKIDTSFTQKGIPNWMNGTSPFIDSLLQRIGDMEEVNMKDYTVGYLWGTTGVLFNTKYVKPEDVESWGFMLNPKYKNKVVMKDSHSDIYNIFINYGRFDEIEKGTVTRNLLASGLTNENIALVEDLLRQARPQMKTFEVDDDKRLMSDGSNWLCVTWNGDAKLAIEDAKEGVNLQFLIPKEGSDCWVDCWVIPSCARNVEAASYWINFLCKSENALRCMKETGYSSAVGTPEILAAMKDDRFEETKDLSYFFGPEASAVHIDTTIYLDRSIIERCSLLRDSGDRQQVMREIWERIKQIRQPVLWPYIAGGCVLILLLLAAILQRRKKRKR